MPLRLHAYYSLDPGSSLSPSFAISLSFLNFFSVCFYLRPRSPRWLSGKESTCWCGRLWVQTLGQEDPLEEEMAVHSSILAWEIPWTEEPGRLQSMGSQRVRHDLATEQVHCFYSVITLQMSPSSDFFILVIVHFSFLFSIWFFSLYFFAAVFCLFICFKGNHNCFLKHFYDCSLQSMSDNSNIWCTSVLASFLFLLIQLVIFLAVSIIGDFLLHPGHLGCCVRKFQVLFKSFYFSSSHPV